MHSIAWTVSAVVAVCSSIVAQDDPSGRSWSKVVPRPATQERRPDPQELRRWVDELRSDDPVVRESAIASLIEAGEACLPRLEVMDESTLSVPSRLARDRVYSALVGLPRAEARALRQGIAEALAAEGSRSLDEAAARIVPRGAAAVEFALRELEARKGSERAALLTRKLGTSLAVHDLANGRNLGDRAAARLAELGEDAMEDLLGLASSAGTEVAVRDVAAERMVHLAGAHDLDPLLALGRAAPTPAQRDLLLDAIPRTARAEDLEAVADVLVPWIGEEPSRAAALTRLADRLEARAVRSQIERGSDRTRILGAELLGLRRDADSRSLLESTLHHRDANVAAAAARALGRIGNEEDVPALASLLGNDAPTLRRSAVEALSSISGAEALAWTAACTRDADPAVRAAAARRLAAHGDESVVELLIASLDDSDRSVAREAESGLRRITGEEVARVDRESPSRREAWRMHWSERREEQSKGAAPKGEAEAGDPARALAGEGYRLLSDLEGSLRQYFRPYGALKEEERTTPTALLEAARQRMLEVIGREKDPEKPERPFVSLEAKQRSPLVHLIRTGRFADAADLAECLGAVSSPLSADDYVLLVHEGAAAMVRSLGDRFTRLQMLEDSRGKIDPDTLPSLFGEDESNGLLLEKTEQRVGVEFVMAGSSAEEAGLRAGDLVLRVGEDMATSLDAETLAKTANRAVELLVLRDGWTRPVRFALAPRRSEPDHLVRSAMLPGKIGYVRLLEFGFGSAQQLEWALRELEKDGMRGLVFDLRGNPGGLVTDAIAIVDKFVGADHTITTLWSNSSTEGQDHDEEILRSSASDSDREYPLAVLVDRNSASASEMTSGALQDLHRAVIVGRRTWGKGIGQSAVGIYGFPRRSVFGESRSVLTLGITLLEYFLPTGRSIQGTGVEPDVPVAWPSLLGERFENLRRAQQHASTAEFVARLLEDRAAAEELARFDGWDTARYPGFAEWRQGLRLELGEDLARRALRAELRRALLESTPRIGVVDVEEDEDLRAALAAIATQAGLDLGAFEEYQDLED